MPSGNEKRLAAWIARQLANPAPTGGRNNQIIQVAPRMLELGWDAEGVVEAFMHAFGYDSSDDSDKEDEIRAAVQSAEKYVQPVTERDKAEVLRRQHEANQARLKAVRLKESILADPSLRWPMHQIIDDGGVDQNCEPRWHTLWFLDRLFEPDEILWMGQTYHSGEPRHASNFLRQDVWSQRYCGGPFISHCTFKPGSYSRCDAAVESKKFLVIESDKLDHDQIGSIFSWFVSRGAVLRAIVHSGNKSLHGWFDRPTDLPDHELKALVHGLDCDPACLRASQPVRLAGALRLETRRHQNLLYLA